MSDYSRVHDFSARDSLPAGDPSKTIVGAEVDQELDAIVTAIASKVDDGTTVTILSTTDSAAVEPILSLHRNSGTPADADFIGEVRFDAEDSGSAQTTYAALTGQIDDVTDTTEDGTLIIKTMQAGTLTDSLDISVAGIGIAQNNQYLLGKDTGGTFENLIGMDSSDIIQVGDAGHAMQFSAGGSHYGFNAAPLDYVLYNLGGNKTSGGASNNSAITLSSGTVTGHTADNGFLGGQWFTNSVITGGATLTIGDVAQMRLDEPNITVGSGDTITNASTLLVTGAPTEGVNNYAILVDGGDIGFPTSLVGIGQVPDTVPLTVRNDSAGALAPALVLKNRATTASTEIAIHFITSTTDYGDSRYATISGINENGATATGLSFKTGSGALPTERMRIENTGLTTITANAGTALKLVNSGGASGNTASTTFGEFVIDSADANLGIEILGGITSTQKIEFSDSVEGRGYVQYAHNGDALSFGAAGAEAYRVDATQRVLIGHTTAEQVGGAVTPHLQVQGTAANDAALSVTRWSANNVGGSIQFGKSRGATIGTHGAVTSGDGLGSIIWAADDGTDLVSYAALITAEIDGTPGANDMPGRLIFETTADGAAVATEAMRINRNQDVFIGPGGTDPSGRLHVQDSATTVMRIESTAASAATLGPIVKLERDGGNSSNAHLLGSLDWVTDSSTGVTTDQGRMFMEIVDATNGSMDAKFRWQTVQDNSLTSVLQLYKGLSTWNATGGDQGADTINASALYDDGVQVTPAALGTEQATTSGSVKIFTGIPSWVTHIDINFEGVSGSSTGALGIQIGDSGGIETTGYLGTSGYLINDTDAGTTSRTTHLFQAATAAATDVLSGTITLTLKDAANNTWCASGVIVDQGGGAIHFTGSVKSLSATLDRVEIDMSAGTFDAGSVNIRYH
jgi:hypothetical protein